MDDLKILEKVRLTIKKAAPRATETVSYGIPTFDFKNRHLVHFGVFKNHLGFFPTPSGVAAFKDDLLGYKTSKGAIQFPFDKPIPYDLIEKITKFRVREINKLESQSI